MADVRIEYMPLSKLVRAPRNPKEHDLGAIHGSIERFGFVSPLILDEGSGRLVAGHGRLDVLQQMKASGKKPPNRVNSDNGEWMVPVVVGIEFEDGAEAEAYLIADNRITELGGWDETELAQVLGDLAAMDALEAVGWDCDDLDRLLQSLEEDAEGAGEPVRESTGELLGLTEITMADPKTEVHTGDIWQVGRHLLICADVVRGWEHWANRLKQGMLFIPYPGPFVAVSEKLGEHTLLMVQPDPYIAGHILDRFSEVTPNGKPVLLGS